LGQSHWLSTPLKLLALGLDLRKLGIAVLVRNPFQVLLVGCQPVAERAQQVTQRRVCNLMPHRL